jgi:hypothetical protein
MSASEEPIVMTLGMIGEMLDCATGGIPSIAAAGLAVMFPDVSITGKWDDRKQGSLALELWWENPPDDAIRVAKTIAEAVVSIPSPCDDTTWFGKCKVHIRSAATAEV